MVDLCCEKTRGHAGQTRDHRLEAAHDCHSGNLSGYIRMALTTKQIVIIGVFAVIVAYLLSGRARTREGFQASPEGELDQQTACQATVMAIDGQRKELEKARAEGIASQVDFLTQLVTTLENQARTLGCQVATTATTA